MSCCSVLVSIIRNFFLLYLPAVCVYTSCRSSTRCGLHVPSMRCCAACCFPVRRRGHRRPWTAALRVFVDANIAVHNRRPATRLHTGQEATNVTPPFPSHSQLVVPVQFYRSHASGLIAVFDFSCAFCALFTLLVGYECVDDYLSAVVHCARLLRRYSDMHALLSSTSPPLIQAVTHCVDGSVVGLMTSDACFIALLTPGLPAGVAHKTAETVLAVVKRARDRFVMNTVPQW